MHAGMRHDAVLHASAGMSAMSRFCRMSGARGTIRSVKTNWWRQPGMKLRIFRFDPDRNDEPVEQEYEIDPALAGPMLLDALLYVREHLDASLALRRSCREGVCGSDGMNVNGVNVLACITPLAELSEPVMIRPLPGLPLIRDLVVDMEPLLRNYRAVHPWLEADVAPAERERLQTPAQRTALQAADECIQCGCCSSACPSFWWRPDEFAGPAALLAAWRFVADSRDVQTGPRLAGLAPGRRLFGCHGVMNCAAVCPKGLNPAAAIGTMKRWLLKSGQHR